MATGASPLATDLTARYAGASSLQEACGVLVEDIRARTPFGRAIVLFLAGAWADAVSVGVEEGETSDLVRSVQAHVHRDHDLPLWGDWPQLPVATAALGFSGPSSFDSPVLVPSVVLHPSVRAAVVVDAHRRHPALDDVADCLRLATPALSRLAETEALRVRVEDLESQRVRASRVLDTLPDPVLVMDEEARILLANRRAEELFTVSPGDSPGRRHAVETNNLFFSAFRARAVLGVKAGNGGSRELLMVDPVDGSDLLFEVFYLQFSGHGIGPESMVYVLRDITDLKRVTLELESQFSRSVAAQHEARRESERLNVIIENAGVPILVTDPQTKIILMNREAERLFELGGRGPESSPRTRDIRANDTKLTGLISDFLLQSLRRREEHLTLVDPDGAREVPAMVVSTKILSTRGEPTAVVSVLHDLTQEVENERLAAELGQLNEELEERIAHAIKELARRNRQLETQRAELERASKLKSEFLATMSHELRTPINAMLGYNSLLEEELFGPLGEQQKHALDRMRGSAEHLLSLINDILDLSKVEAGKVVLHPAEMRLEDFGRTVSETGRIMAEERGLAYRVEVEPGLPGVTVDETRLRQVLLNLLSNAVKFTEVGSVTLRIGSGPRPGWIRIEVIDTGIGIPEEELDPIFEEFRQVDQSITRQHGGAGLGLAISRKLVSLMGGTLTAHSVRGEGATFRVDLPIRPVAAHPQAAERRATAVPPSLESGGRRADASASRTPEA